MKTYQLKALWPLLSFEVAAAPLRATLDAYGEGLVKYAVDHEGLWLFAPAQLLEVNESEALTGFHPADLMPKKIDGVDGYFYGRQDGLPLLPIPFTTDQLSEFETRTADFVAGSIERGSETDAWIDDLEKNNPDAAELARGIRYGTWPEDSDTDMDTIQAALDVADALVKHAETVQQRRDRYLELFEAEEKHCKRGALTRIASREGVDRSNMKKDIEKARLARDEQTRAGYFWGTQLTQGGKRAG